MPSFHSNRVCRILTSHAKCIDKGLKGDIFNSRRFCGRVGFLCYVLPVAESLGTGRKPCMKFLAVTALPKKRIKHNIKGNGKPIPSNDKEEDNEKQSKKVVGTDFVGGDDGYPVENAGLCGDGERTVGHRSVRAPHRPHRGLRLHGGNTLSLCLRNLQLSERRRERTAAGHRRQRTEGMFLHNPLYRRKGQH